MADTEPGRADDGLIAVGRVGPARGVRGEVFVEPWTDAPEQRFAPGAELATDPDTTGPLTVASSSTAGGKLVVHFAGVPDRAAAEALRGVRLLIVAADRPALTDPEEFYDTDLVGLRALDPSGAPIGPVVDVVHAAAATYLVVSLGGRDRLVPFVSAVVPQVDPAGGTVTIDAPEGLWDV